MAYHRRVLNPVQSTPFNELRNRTVERFSEERVRGRYAPSPTGALHLGNIRTALCAWLHARLTHGQFVLRIDDLDGPRVRPGAVEQIIDDLRWIGLDWNEGPTEGGKGGPYFQSARILYYEAAFDMLRDAQKIYPCYCSRQDISRLASAPHEGQATIRYPGTCRDLSENELAEKRQNQGNRSPAWRFRVPNEIVELDDVVMGKYSQHVERDVGDFVIRRGDGVFSYHLAVVVDDGLMGITDVVRGSDLLDSTPRQMVLQRELGLPNPRYWHVPLMRDAYGQRLSKRDGSESVAAWRLAGQSPSALIKHLFSSLDGCIQDGELGVSDLLRDLTFEGLRTMLREATHKET